jgi:hypothetical protein
MNEIISLNNAQASGLVLNAPKKVDIWGRGTGKSYVVGWDVNLINRIMPRAVTSVTGQTYGQLLTRTLPSTFKFLEKLGHVKDKTYRVCQKPLPWWETPYERIMKYDNFISFSGGNGLLLLSQDRQGSGRGPNVDFEVVDEALTINKVRYDEETSPTNRGNDEYFGPKSPKPIPMHHGFHFVSSMPYTAEGKWLLDYAAYYEEEAGIRLFDIWNRIIRMQLELLEITDPKDFKHQWNEIARVRKQISPFISKDGILFTLSNAFDNIDNVGLSYIKRQREKQTDLIFMIEIMNMFLSVVEDCYYQLDPDKHVYHNAYNESFLRDYAEDTNWDWQKLGSPDSRFDSDVDPDEQLELVFDWGSSISFMLVCQENNLVTQKMESFNFLHEFFVKPQRGRVMIDDLIDEFCEYYRYHKDKTVVYYRDKYGDIKQANSSETYNEQAINRLIKNGWEVVIIEYKGNEPPHHEKYLFWANILKERNPELPIVRINGTNCKHFVVALNNTRVIEKDNKFKKDKRSENQKSSVPQEEATHSTDAADKIIWIKYRSNVTRSSFVPARY